MNKKYKVGVVIPCRNEKKSILETLRCLYRSDVQDIDLEVILVDGRSDDGTLELINSHITEFPNLRVIINEHQKTPYAFNIGIRASQQDYIITVGARHQLSEKYLINCVKAFENNPEIACVGGKSIAIFDNDDSRAIALAMSSPFGVGAGNFRTAEVSQYVDTVGTPMYRKNIFNKIGFFDENLTRNQDDELNYRLTEAGYKIWLQHDAIVRYIVRPSFIQLYKQYFQYGYWKVYVNKKHSAVTTKRQLVPPLFVLFILSFIIIFIIPFYKWLYLTGIIAYTIGLLAASFKLTANLGLLFKIVFSFFCLHFGYGLGYLKGIIDFMILNHKPSQNMEVLTR